MSIVNDSLPLIRRAFEQTFNTTLYGADLEEHEKLIRFIEAYVVKGLYPVILSPDYIVQFTHDVFTTEIVRDFMLNLTFRFVSLVGGNVATEKALVEALATGIAADVSHVSEEYRTTPRDVSSRLLTITEARDLLAHNNWIKTFLMLSMVIGETNFKDYAIEVRQAISNQARQDQEAT